MRSISPSLSAAFTAALKKTSELEALVVKLETNLNNAEKRVRLLEEQLRLERIKKYGPKSDALNNAQLTLLECEPGVSAREVETEAGTSEAEKEESKAAVEEEKSKKPRRKVTRGEFSIPPNLPVVEVIVPCPKEECTCKNCGKERKVIGYECSRRLGLKPAEYYCEVIKREKVACPNCEECGVDTAPMPPQIIEKGIASNELVVHVLAQKYLNHIPLYRIESRLLRDLDIHLTRQTMCGWVMECGFLLQAVQRELMQDLILGGYIQADETRIGVQTDEVKGRNHNGFLWEYSRPDGPVVFDYRDGRGREGPVEMLKGFRGILQTDDYSVYNRFDLEGIIRAACMAHVRRKFVDAAKVHTKDLALIAIIEKIRKLYAIEEEARGRSLNAEERLAFREEQATPIMAELKNAIVGLRQDVLPMSLQGKACDYALGVWEQLETYLEDGRIEIDNNACERAIRPVAVGRKNWLHLGSKSAGPRVAAILSVLGTCERIGISAVNYLRDVLPKLAKGMASQVAKLTPMAWKQAQEGGAATGGASQDQANG